MYAQDNFPGKVLFYLISLLILLGFLIGNSFSDHNLAQVASPQVIPTIIIHFPLSNPLYMILWVIGISILIWPITLLSLAKRMGLKIKLVKRIQQRHRGVKGIAKKEELQRDAWENLDLRRIANKGEAWKNPDLKRMLINKARHQEREEREKLIIKKTKSSENKTNGNRPLSG